MRQALYGRQIQDAVECEVATGEARYMESFDDEESAMYCDRCGCTHSGRCQDPV